VTNESREVLADWMIVIGAAVLFLSLFLTWSHQFSPAFLAVWGKADLLRGVPRDPTAWQVYSAADILLALLAVALVAAAMVGTPRLRMGALVGGAVGLGFTLHALSSPPTNGGNIFNPALSVPHYASSGATAGVGETVAILALLVALGGLAISFTAD
jgi:hypothetical protein